MTSGRTGGGSRAERGGTRRGLRWRAGLATGLLLACHAAGLLTAPQAHAAPCAAVSAQDAGVVDVIDCAGRAVIARIPVGPLPVGLAVDNAGARLYVTRPDYGAIGVVDLSTCRLIGEFTGLGSPFAVVVADGRLIVSDWSGDRLLALDPADGRILAQAGTGKAPAGLAVDRVRGRVFVAVREADRLDVFALPDLTPAGSVAVGTAPFAVAIDGDTVVSVNVRSGDLSFVDATKLEVTRTVAVGHMPYAAVVAGTHLLVTNQQSGTLSLVTTGGDGDGPQAVAEEKVGAYPEGIALVDGVRRAMVAGWFSDDVRLVDPNTGKTEAVIATDAGPRIVAALEGQACDRAQVAH